MVISSPNANVISCLSDIQFDIHFMRIKKQSISTMPLITEKLYNTQWCSNGHGHGDHMGAVFLTMEKCIKNMTL